MSAHKAITALITILLMTLSSIDQVLADTRTLTTLPLRNVLPTQVLPVIRPLLSSESTATEFNNQLILNVTNDELLKIQQLLITIDQRPRQLLFTVLIPSNTLAKSNNININGKIGNEKISVGTGRTNPYTNSHLHIEANKQLDTNTSSQQQQIRAQEGVPAYISIGTGTPVTHQYRTINGKRITEHSYYPINQSFSAVARIIDNGHVIIDIDQQNNQLNNSTIIQRKGVSLADKRHAVSSNTPTFQTQVLSTQAQGKLGEWIPLGHIDQDEHYGSSGFNGESQHQEQSSTQIMIKVDVIDE